jgi:hypothetical protein
MQADGQRTDSYENRLITVMLLYRGGLRSDPRASETFFLASPHRANSTCGRGAGVGRGQGVESDAGMPVDLGVGVEVGRRELRYLLRVAGEGDVLRVRRRSTDPA